MPAQPLHQSLTLTSYTLLKASAYLHLRVCHCLACTEVRIFLQHQECPGSLWKLVCRKEQTHFLSVGKYADIWGLWQSGIYQARGSLDSDCSDHLQNSWSLSHPRVVFRPHTVCNTPRHIELHRTPSTSLLSSQVRNTHPDQLQIYSTVINVLQSPSTNTE